MGVRPPTGGNGEAAAVEFGIAALAPEVDAAELEFPAAPAEVVRALDDPAIPVDARGHEMTLSTALEEVDAREFDTKRELLNALHPVFESHREGPSAGWLDSLRRTLPF